MSTRCPCWSLFLLKDLLGKTRSFRYKATRDSCLAWYICARFSVYGSRLLLVALEGFHERKGKAFQSVPEGLIPNSVYSFR